MFEGYAIDHGTCTVYPFRSTYRSRDSVRRNLERCIEEQAGVKCVISPHDMELHTPRAAEGMGERMEGRAADLVRGNAGVDTGYAVHPRVIDVEPKEGDGMEDMREAYEAKPLTRDQQRAELAALEIMADEMGLSFKTTSLCIWVSGETKPIKEDLKRLGLRWAPKRQAWYWRLAA